MKDEERDFRDRMAKLGPIRYRATGGEIRPHETVILETTNPKDRLGLLKAPLRLVPPALVIETAPAMANGAAKYGAYNWRTKEVILSIYLEATLRHIFAYMDGEERAEDSGVKHLAHAAACLAIIFDADSLGKLVDDRPLPGAASSLLAAQVKT